MSDCVWSPAGASWVNTIRPFVPGKAAWAAGAAESKPSANSAARSRRNPIMSSKLRRQAEVVQCHLGGELVVGVAMHALREHVYGLVELQRHDGNDLLHQVPVEVSPAMDPWISGQSLAVLQLRLDGRHLSDL